jgi:hypothetical protein
MLTNGATHPPEWLMNEVQRTDSDDHNIISLQPRRMVYEVDIT